MAQFPNIFNCDLHSGPVSASIRQMYLGDIAANRVGVRVTNNGEAVALSGTCSGTAMLYNGGTVALTGVVDGNVAYVDLPAAVYSVEGPLKIFVTLTHGGSTTTLIEMRSNVTRTESGVVIDPGTIIPSVAALISDIEDAVASIPEDYSELSADVVQLKSDMTEVKPEVETLGEDVSDLIGATCIKTLNDYQQNSGVFKSDGTWTSATSANYKHIVIPILPSDNIKVTAGERQAVIAVFASYTTPVNGNAIPFSSATGFTTGINISAGQSVEITAPNDAAYLCVYMLNGGNSTAPSHVIINNIDVSLTTVENLTSIAKVAVHASTVDELKSRTSYNIFADYPTGQGLSNSSGNWAYISANYMHSVIDVVPGDAIQITADQATWYAILTSYSMPVLNNPIPFSSATGFTSSIPISGSSTVAFTAPADAAYLIVGIKSGGNDCTPSAVVINGVDIIKTPVETLKSVAARTAVVESQENETRLKEQQLEESIHFYAIPAMEQHSGMITITGLWNYVNDPSHVYKHVIIPVSPGDIVYCAGCTTALAFLRSYTTPVALQAVDLSAEEGYTNVKTINGGVNTYTVPSDVTLLYVRIVQNGTPDSFTGTLTINAVPITTPLVYTLQRLLNPEKTVNWCAMGDSITAGYYSEFVEGGGAEYHVNMSKNWSTLVANALNWNLTNIACGGEGYLDLASISGVEMRGYIRARNTDFTPYDIVTLSYGINDWKGDVQMGSFEDDQTAQTITSFIPAMRATLEAIMTSNPFCKIIVITPLNCNGYEHNYGTQATNWGMGYAMSNSGTLKQFRDKMIEICELYGVQYIDMSSASCINSIALPTMLPDGVHPALETHRLLAMELAKKITF